MLKIHMRKGWNFLKRLKAGRCNLCSADCRNGDPISILCLSSLWIHSFYVFEMVIVSNLSSMQDCSNLDYSFKCPHALISISNPSTGTTWLLLCIILILLWPNMVLQVNWSSWIQSYATSCCSKNPSTGLITRLLGGGRPDYDSAASNYEKAG